MKYPCDMIRDLIPLSNDGVASTSSKQAVDEHLAECFPCREYRNVCPAPYEQPYLAGENDAHVAENAKSYSKRGKKRYRVLIAIAIALTAIIIFCAVTLPGFVFGRMTIWSRNYETHNGSEYMQFGGHIEHEERSLLGHTDLLVFPEAISENSSVHSYYCYCSDFGIKNAYSLYLDYTLPEGQFNNEVEKLANLSVSYEGQCTSVIYNEDDFKFPAYITAFRRNENSDFGVFEYALVDKDNRRILCVLVQDDYLSNLPIDDALKPPAQVQYGDEVLGFSIYEFPFSAGVHITLRRMGL